MVLLHGLTEDGTTWPDAVERWGDRFELIAPDLRGHGRSPRFTQSQLRSTGEVMLADVTALLDTLGRPVVLVGHSLGGYLAATAALARPDLVSAVVLEDPAKPANSAADRFDEDRFRREQVEFVEEVTADPECAVARMRRETPWSAAEIDAWAASKARVDRAYLREGLRQPIGPWEQGLFSDLKVPTLVVVPTRGDMAPDLAKVGNPLVERVDVDGAGHCVRRDRPERFYPAVKAFLERARQ